MSQGLTSLLLVVLRPTLTFAFTYTDAQFGDGTASGNADSTIFAGAIPGNELAYIPEIQWNVTTGIDADRWSFHVATTYVGDSHGDGSNLGLEKDTSGTADARFGNIDSYFLIDLSYRYQLSDTTSLFASVQNALDETWLASRIPHGPRPGAPRQTSVGVDWQF